MCIKLHKRLNPNAPEWAPHHSLTLPAAAPENPFFQLPPPPYYYHYPHPRFHHHHLQGFVPFHHQYVSSPFPVAVTEYCYYKPEKTCHGAEKIHPLMGFEEENATGKPPAVRKVVEMKSPVKKSPKCPPAAAGDGFRKGAVRRVPPRLQRAVGFYGEEEKTPSPPPPPPRKVWKPKGKAAAGVRKPALSTSPPLLSRDRFYHPSSTTVMIKNIPNQLRRDFMLEFLDACCKAYSLEYDFFYLPMDFRSNDNLGYAFVNFTSGGAAVKFKKIIHMYKWGEISIDGKQITSKKVCEITWARIQGKEALLCRFKSSNFICDKLEFLPVVLDPPRNGSDPNPASPVILGTMQPRLS